MKLSQLAAKPQLVQITLDDEDTIKEFGEPLEFWTFDRQPLEIFMKLAAGAVKDPGSVLDIVRMLILDENGKPIVTDESMLPTTVLIRVIAKMTNSLGK